MSYFQKLVSLLKLEKRNEKFSDNHGDNILELYIILERFVFTTSKTVVDIYYKKYCVRVPSRPV